VGDRPYPTAGAADHRRGGLHHQLDLTINLSRVQHAEAAHTQQDSANLDTLYSHLGPLVIAALDSREYREASGLSEGGHTTRTPRFAEMSRFAGMLAGLAIVSVPLIVAGVFFTLGGAWVSSSGGVVIQSARPWSLIRQPRHTPLGRVWWMAGEVA
jgi:hypothetical protein